MIAVCNPWNTAGNRHPDWQNKRFRFLTKQAGIVKVSSSISVDIACVVFDLTFLMAVKAQSCKYYDQNSNYNYGQTFFHNIESSLVSCILPFIPLCYKILS